ncbi:MAG TPA: LysR family transcriptional regulator [Sphingobium sp.]|uniref:LysR family transcriptional regulator n=1 Tax=Sphingobium sp. TaxID=1912891 RepID=UPI002ED13DB8
MTRREELASLSMFLTVAEERSFTRAAAKLGISQSALSHAMRRLEARLGLRLLTRTTRSVAPTEAGERLIEALAPALDQIDNRLAALTELRERPAGTVRITAPKHAGRTLLWPVMNRLAAEYPDVHFELNLNDGLTDIVTDRYDAGVRLGERIDKDMIAVRIGPQLRTVAVAAPSYFAKRGIPKTPHDLSAHSCINLRMESAGGLYVWEFDRDGRELRVRVEGQLIFNDVDLTTEAALAGHGIALLMEDRVSTQIADGSLIRVLDDWCEPFDGYHLYYPSRRQPSPAFTLLLEALRYRE